MDALLLTIHSNSAEPFYRQIIEQLRRQIGAANCRQAHCGRLCARSGFHAFNTMTIYRAYNLAERAGLLERQRGNGLIDRNGAGKSARCGLAGTTLPAAPLGAFAVLSDAGDFFREDSRWPAGARNVASATPSISRKQGN